MKPARHRRRANRSSPEPRGVSAVLTATALAARPSRGWTVPVCAALALAVLIVYAPAFGHGFVNFDDPQYVVENPHVRPGLTWSGVTWALTATHAGNWHPVTWWSHMLDVELFGLDARGHHATSILLHLVNTLLLFVLLHRTTRQPGPSVLVAAIFGVHPLHVESVAWIAERKDVLSTLFALLAMHAYIRYVERPSRVRYALVLAWFVAGLAAKPMLVTLPFVLLLLDVWPLGRLPVRFRLHDLRPRLVEKIPLFVCTVISSVVTYVVQQSAGAVRDFAVLPLSQRLATATLAYVDYVAKTFWPVDLAPLYPYTTHQPGWKVTVAAAVLALTTFAAFRTRAGRGYVPVGWFWFLGMLVPVIGIVQVGSQPMADRYMYLPLVGLLIVFAWGLRDVAPFVAGGTRLFAATGVALVLMSMAVARQQVAIWAGSLDLWEHTIRVSRANYRAHGNYAHALAAAGRPGEGIAHYETAIRLNPDSVEARTGLAALLASAGRLDEAVYHYRRALSVRPADATAHVNLGAALAARGDLTDAERHLRAALGLAPDLAAVHSGLGITLARSGRTAEARAHFSKAVALAPGDPAARRHLGASLAADERWTEAIAEFDAAIQLDPADPLTRNARGAALAGAGKLEAAAAEYEQAVSLNPSFGEARANLGNALGRLGRTADAVVHLREAVRLRPGDTPARYDLVLALVEEGHHAEAREQLDLVLRDEPGHEAARKLRRQRDDGATPGRDRQD